MNNQEVREHVCAELRRRGHEKPEAISNKVACKLLGLMPDNVIGIGRVNGGKMLKAWCGGDLIAYDNLGGVLREERKPVVPRVKPDDLRFQSKKVARVKLRQKFKKSAFYESREWREVRYQALKRCGAACQCCGRSAKDGVVIHVDHIKPRSLHPELELSLANLQILCEECNLGKSNKDDTDWRPTVVDCAFE